MVINPIPYGQSEVHIFIARNDDMPNQCYTCHSRSSSKSTRNARTRMGTATRRCTSTGRPWTTDPDSNAYGDLTVVHPIWDEDSDSGRRHMDGEPKATERHPQRPGVWKHTA